MQKNQQHTGRHILVKQGNVDPSTSTQIGIRGNPRTLDWLQASYDIGYQVITMDEYKELGHEKCSTNDFR